MENSSFPTSYTTDLSSLKTEKPTLLLLVAYEAIFKYCSPFVLVLGLLSNTLAIVVLANKSMRKAAVSFLLGALSVSNIGCLLTEVVYSWTLHLTEYRVNIRGLNLYWCRLHMFVTFFCHHLSPMTLVFLTVQRVIAVYLPLQTKIILSRGNTIRAWTVMAVSLAALNAAAFFEVNYGSKFAGTHCFYRGKYRAIFESIDSVLESYLPCSVITVGNVMIIIRIKLRSLKGLSAPAQGGDATSRKSTTDSMTTMLVVLTTAFVILTAPYYFFILVFADFYNPDERVYAKSAFIYSILYQLFELNFAISFILYSAAGSRFRKAVKNIFKPAVK